MYSGSVSRVVTSLTRATVGRGSKVAELSRSVAAGILNAADVYLLNGRASSVWLKEGSEQFRGV